MRYIYNSPKSKKVFILVSLLALMTGAGLAEIKLPAVIGSYMVLQQDQPIRLWGWGIPGEQVSVAFHDRSASVQVDGNGRWRMTLDPMPAGRQSYRMTFTGSKSPAKILENIVVGEVWVCSGQSNMEWTMQRTHSPGPEILRADHPGIRLFDVPRKAASSPQEDVEAEWKICSPETIRSFSAVAYYFGRELHQKLELPVGLINSSWGGTRIEPWTPPAGFQAVPELRPLLEEIAQSDNDYRQELATALPEWKQWLTRVESALSADGPIPPSPELPRHALADSRKPTALYNGMIHPLANFPIRGAIWYQGEANRNDGAVYSRKMEAMITGWRKVWKVGDFPFYYVQLAPFNYGYNRGEDESPIPDFERLPVIWEAQQDALRIPHTGMAVINDIGNLNDIHPRNKADVGHRLALWARAKTYGEKDIVFSGPLYRAMTVEGDRIRIAFDHSQGGLISLDGLPLRWFEIAGQDRIYYRAKADISGKTLLVWSPRVKAPTAVRFGWHQLAEPNLGNSAGLPAAPFRTERW